MILAFLLLPACFVSLSTHSTTPSVLLAVPMDYGQPYKQRVANIVCSEGPTRPKKGGQSANHILSKFDWHVCMSSLPVFTASRSHATYDCLFHKSLPNKKG